MHEHEVGEAAREASSGLLGFGVGVPQDDAIHELGREGLVGVSGRRVVDSVLGPAKVKCTLNRKSKTSVEYVMNNLKLYEFFWFCSSMSLGSLDVATTADEELCVERQFPIAFQKAFSTRGICLPLFANVFSHSLCTSRRAFEFGRNLKIATHSRVDSRKSRPFQTLFTLQFIHSFVAENSINVTIKDAFNLISIQGLFITLKNLRHFTFRKVCLLHSCKRKRTCVESLVFHCDTYLINRELC